MQISSNYTATGIFGGEPSAAQIQKTDSAFAAFLSGSDDSAQSMLTDITSGGTTGLLKWQVKELQKKITEQVMAGKNLTADSVAAMPAKQRIATEQQIMREVSEKLKQAIAEQMKKQNPQAAVIDGFSNASAIAAADAASLNMVV